MDERILTILKEVAQEHTQDYDGMNTECVFPSCTGEYDYITNQCDQISHSAECPTTLARAVLRELGSPLRLYKITYDRTWHNRLNTFTDNFNIGYTEDEAKQRYEGEGISNIRVEYVKDM